MKTNKTKAKPLADYSRKRDLKKTPEPAAKVQRSKTKTIFVIQQHAATRLHWDFRLEAEGVLKSWAVTKEPTMDPAIKRLAVRVEDHPLAYATFHGDIPKGSYGGGHVDIWDNGTYEPKGDIIDGLKAGKVECNLHGKKLEGMFALVRMGKPGAKENWLLIKMRDEFAKEGSAGPKSVKAPKSKKQPAAQKNARAKSESVKFTHLDKMMFPEAGLTKGDILDYYAKISDRLLPHLKDRPMTLERLPDGLASPTAPRFWQKNTPSYYPDWIPRIEIESETGKPVQYVLVNDANTLLYLVNQGAITFHPFLSRTRSLAHPDFVLFDLDPGEAPFADAVKIARKLHELLDEENANSFLKTSGKSGLHILSPWKKDGGYDDARSWAGEVASQVVQALPKIATVERSKVARKGRVYVDVMQNVEGHHAVPPYVIRAVPEATVSMPLNWDDLNAKLNPRKFTTKFMLQKMAREKTDLFEPLIRSQ